MAIIFTTLKIGQNRRKLSTKIFNEYNLYIKERNITDNEYSKYEHDEIRYIKETTGKLIVHQNKLIEDEINNVYSELDKNELNWINVINFQDINKFTKLEENLIHFIKNFYDILVNKFSLNKMYNIKTMRFFRKDDVINSEIVNVLSYKKPLTINKTLAIQEAKNVKDSNSFGHKPGFNTEDLYRKWGLSEAIFGLQLEDSFNNEMNSEYLNNGTPLSAEYDEFIWQNESRWIYTPTNIQSISNEIGNNIDEAIAKIKDVKSLYILDAIFNSLNYEYNLSNKIINLLIAKNKIYSKSDYDEILSKFVRSLAKLSYSLILMILPIVNIDFPIHDAKKDSFFQIANEKNINVYGAYYIFMHEISKTLNKDPDDVYRYLNHGTDNSNILYIKAMSSDIIKNINTDESYGVNLFFNYLRNEFNLGVNLITTAVLTSSSSLISYLNNIGKIANRFLSWTALYNKLSFIDEFNTKFEVNYYSWYRYNKLFHYTAYNSNKKGSPDNTKFITNEYYKNEFFRNISSYTPVSE
ncbi:hypothetical protein NPA07_02570 [Mycoplasmopsis caviae]|uniref:Uncharacterized protein n=1 Tax=Mycoplasmopsis caviae TaxID=55603 RepID=A0ABY5J3T7_9BACT|nr:hypothetical protein [Mycoplasmopsis caviae]UUD35736.1 hypothetical protein NPA07_02570 [Mycoplasmopsis caviae]